MLALENALGHQTIEQLNRDLQAKVEKISEQQRRILALQTQLRQRSEATDAGWAKRQAQNRTCGAVTTASNNSRDATLPTAAESSAPARIFARCCS